MSVARLGLLAALISLGLHAGVVAGMYFLAPEAEEKTVEPSPMEMWLSRAPALVIAGVAGIVGAVGIATISPTSQPTVAPEESPAFHKQRVIVSALAAVGAVATFLPWATLGPISADGTHSGGWATLTLFAAVIAVALLRGPLPASLLAGDRFAVGAVAVGAALIGIWKVSIIIRADVPLVDVGIGLLLVIGCGLGLVGFVASARESAFAD